MAQVLDSLLFPFQLVKLCIAMIDTGKAFCVANKQFILGIQELAQYSSQDSLLEVSVGSLVRPGKMGCDQGQALPHTPALGLLFISVTAQRTPCLPRGGFLFKPRNGRRKRKGGGSR